VKRLFGRSASTGVAPATDGDAHEAERLRVLIEESRESVIVLDPGRRVLAASRRARETVQGLVEGAPFPDDVLSSRFGRTAVEIPVEIGGRTETLLYLSSPGDFAAYEELRAGFTAAVSHELRTPLARLMALLDSVSLPGADTAVLIEDARREVVQMGELIDDVMFLSELESGRAAVALGTTSALPVLDQVVRRLSPRAEAAGVRIVLDCPASMALPLRQRMLDVLAGNLVENAIRYAGEGSTCTIAVAATARGTALTVSDSGRGVPDEDLSRLFERFFRSDRARASRGTGLGLAIVKHIVTSAGGTVTAGRAPEDGLEIRCDFPSPA
jgi:signal transduction histidine kinase